jgi:hypothetical protein
MGLERDFGDRGNAETALLEPQRPERLIWLFADKIDQSEVV